MRRTSGSIFNAHEFHEDGLAEQAKMNLSLLQQKRTDTLAQFNNILFVFTSTLINDIDLSLEFFSVQVF